MKCGPRKRSNRRFGVPVTGSRQGASGARSPGISPLTALHRHFRAGLDRRDPVTGLNDHLEVLTFHRLVFTTPSQAGRLIRYTLDDEEALAAALGGDITARLQAAQVIAVQRVLARTTWQKLVAGRTADDVYPEAVADADGAFALLQTGTRDATTTSPHRG